VWTVVHKWLVIMPLVIKFNAAVQWIRSALIWFHHSTGLAMCF